MPQHQRRDPRGPGLGAEVPGRGAGPGGRGGAVERPRRVSDRLLAWVPIFTVQDATASARFYVEVLGFTLDWEHRFAEGWPLYVQVSRDGLSLHLSEHGADKAQTSDLYVSVADVDATWAAMVARGLTDVAAPEDREYGVRDFDLHDPDGHHLTFGTPLKAP
ncbi:MAG: VOC family protein [Alphaproteobacteria bacterium]|nr:VOC family protein [Alphaproteobacteria bacterium]